MATQMLSSVTPPVAAPAAQAATASAAGTEVNATPLADWYNSYTSANAGTTPAAPAAAEPAPTPEEVVLLREIRDSLKSRN